MDVNDRGLKLALKHMDLHYLRVELEFFKTHPNAKDAAVYVEAIKRELDRRGEKHE